MLLQHSQIFFISMQMPKLKLFLVPVRFSYYRQYIKIFVIFVYLQIMKIAQKMQTIYELMLLMFRSSKYILKMTHIVFLMDLWNFKGGLMSCQAAFTQKSLIVVSGLFKHMTDRILICVQPFMIRRNHSTITANIFQCVHKKPV